jgi:hypothetical protein
MEVDQVAELSKFFLRKLAGFDEVGDESMRGAVENAVEELADHGFCRSRLCDGGRPLMAAGGALSLDESFIEHYAEHGGDGGRCYVSLASQRFAQFAEGQWATVPEDTEDFELAVGGMGTGGTGHGEFLFSGWSG